MPPTTDLHLADARPRLGSPVLRRVLLALDFPEEIREQKTDAIVAAYARHADWRLTAAWHGPVPVGLIGVQPVAAGHAEIRHLAVLPEDRRHGIGSRLVQHAVDDLELATLRAETDSDAVGFYRRRGFAVHSLGEKYPGTERFDCILDVGDRLRVRAAFPGEAAHLTSLSLASRACWGYDEAFLEACRDELTITGDDIRHGTVRVATRAGGILGYYRLGHAQGGSLELDDLFVDAAHIGSGVGRALFDHARETARQRGAPGMEIVADPHAEGFYRAMGARRIGERASESIPGRQLPLLWLSLDDGPAG